MSRNSTRGYLILGILFVLISVLCFFAPLDKTAAFWIAYAFAVAAFAAQTLVWKRALNQKETLESRFLGLPLLYVGTAYLIVQVVVSAAFLFAPTLPTWSAIIACAVTTGAAGICLVSADASLDEVERTDKKTLSKCHRFNEMHLEIELLAARETDPEAKEALRQLAETIRFSDPMSNKRLEELEERIARKISELKTATGKAEAAREIDLLLYERNAKCRILK